MKKNIKIGVQLTKVNRRTRNRRTYQAMFLKAYTMQGRGEKRSMFVRNTTNVLP